MATNTGTYCGEVLINVFFFYISGLIASIKQHTIDLQDARKRASKIYCEASTEAKTLQEPLRLAVLDNNELKRQMVNYDRDKAALKVFVRLLQKAMFCLFYYVDRGE